MSHGGFDFSFANYKFKRKLDVWKKYVARGVKINSLSLNPMVCWNYSWWSCSQIPIQVLLRRDEAFRLCPERQKRSNVWNTPKTARCPFKGRPERWLGRGVVSTCTSCRQCTSSWAPGHEQRCESFFPGVQMFVSRCAHAVWWHRILSLHDAEY